MVLVVSHGTGDRGGGGGGSTHCQLVVVVVVWMVMYNVDYSFMFTRGTGYCDSRGRSGRRPNLLTKFTSKRNLGAGTNYDYPSNIYRSIDILYF